MSSIDTDMQESDTEISGDNTFETRTLSLTLPPAAATLPAITHEKPPPYSIVWERAWPVDKTIPQRITGEDLPHVHDSHARILACTVRYILSPRTNTKSAKTKADVRTATMDQLAHDDEIWDDVQVSFPPIQTVRGVREPYMDISVSTPDLFNKISNLRLYDGEFECQIKGRGAPVPANILTVCVSGLPAQTNIKTTAQELYNQLNKHRPDEIEVWDVFARYQKFPKNPNALKFCGEIYACVRFKFSPPTIFPDDYVRDTFPGYISLHRRSYELEYACRINHCYQCKENAITPHTEKECTRLKCYACNERGHTRKDCPKFNGETKNNGEPSGGNKRARVD